MTKVVMMTIVMVHENGGDDHDGKRGMSTAEIVMVTINSLQTVKTS